MRISDFLHCSTQGKKLLKIVIAFVPSVIVLVMLNACTLQLLPPINDEQSQTKAQETEVGIALLSIFAETGAQTIHLHPVDNVITTISLTEESIAALSAVYKNRVQLEYALVYQKDIQTEEGGPTWKLLYISGTLPITVPALWQEYVLYAGGTEADHISPDRSRRMQRWTGYVIQNPTPLTLTVGAKPPTTLSQWVDQILMEPDTSRGAITRLLFSVQEQGKTQYVLYMSGLSAAAEPFEPDGPDTCASNLSGSYYCSFVAWWYS